MSAKKAGKKNETDNSQTSATRNIHEDSGPPANVLTSQQDVLDELKMGQKQFITLLRKYPFANSGSAGKINGRWHVTVEDVWRWHRYVQQQELRHPDARRMRPVEPPDITDIRTRA